MPTERVLRLILSHHFLDRGFILSFSFSSGFHAIIVETFEKLLCVGAFVLDACCGFSCLFKGVCIYELYPLVLSKDLDFMHKLHRYSNSKIHKRTLEVGFHIHE
jgi:hypothetical protein